MKKVLAFMGAQAIVFSPLIALAGDGSDTTADLGPITGLFNKFIALINETLIPLVFALALLVFFYGIFKYFILGGGDEGSREQGKQLMLWAIIGFVVMVSIYGIITLVAKGLGINNSDANSVTLPKAPTSGSTSD